MKIGIVVAKFNSEITERLCDGAYSALKEYKLATADIIKFEVPGAFEIPLAAKILFTKNKVAGVIALGAVIQGDTKHFDYVCSAAERGCTQVALELEKPIGFGVLTTNTFEQAWDRCALDSTNKGYETAHAVMDMVKKVL